MLETVVLLNIYFFITGDIFSEIFDIYILSAYISQYCCFFSICDLTNAALMNIRDFFKSITNLTDSQTFEQQCTYLNENCKTYNILIINHIFIQHLLWLIQFMIR